MNDVIKHAMENDSLYVECDHDPVTGELYHYGVKGMKWGVRRASYKQARNERLAKKALNYDKKSAIYAKRSEKAHAEIDLARSNEAATKAAKYDIKAAKLEKKALKADGDLAKARLHKKAEKAKYKAAVNRTEAESISKQAGYGHKAMQLASESNRLAAKAEKARYKMAKNEHYIAKMNSKISSLSPEEYERGRSYIEKYMRQAKED